VSSKPIVGITLDYLNDDESNRYSNFPWYALRQQYSKAILDSGGIPLFLPFESYSNSVNEVIYLIDGLLIPGGDYDIPPNMYNNEIKFDTKPAIDRSNNEILILKAALDANMPVLGICHGMQLLNVFLGGDLYQSIKDEIANSINHKNKMRQNPEHEIHIIPSTKLDRIAESKTHRINSNHRQAVKNLGSNLIISAISPLDGVIEAIESISHNFVLGIEWHPEIIATPDLDKKLFSAFIDASKEYKNAKTI
jgi:putative glutamine amidotransferase